MHFKTEYEITVTAEHHALGLPVGTVLRFDPSGPAAAPGDVVAICFKNAPAILGRLSHKPLMHRQTPMITIETADGGRTAFRAFAVMRVDRML